MSYNYTQLHQIIEMQYKINNNLNKDDNSLLNQTAKLFKGYINPSSYLNNIMSNNNNNLNIIIQEDEPLYIDK